MSSFCYWEVYKDIDFYLLIGICAIAFFILIYIIKQLVSIAQVFKKLDKKIILIYLFCFLWALLYIIKILYSILEYKLVLKESLNQDEMLEASRNFCVVDTLSTFFLMYLLILIPYFWLENISSFLQKMRRNQKKDKIILKFFSVYIYLRVPIFLSLFISELVLRDEKSNEAVCQSLIEIILCQVFLSFGLLCYGLLKLFKNFKSLNLHDQRDKKKFRNEYLIMIGCSFIRFAMDFYFIIYDKSQMNQKTCFQHRSDDYLYTTLYIIFGEPLMHLLPIITILSIYRINFQNLLTQSLIESS